MSLTTANVDQVEMPYQRISAQDKERLYAAHMRSEDYVKLARQLGIKRSTAWAIINRAQKIDGQVTVPRGGLRVSCQVVNDDIARTAEAIVENSFSQWKAAIKRQLSEVREQILAEGHEQRLATKAQIAEQSVSVVNPADGQGYFRHL